jgi:hypothetical protein
LLKNSHLAAVLENPLVRRSAATPPRGFLRCDDLTIFEQPEFFNNLLVEYQSAAVVADN